MLAEFSAVSEPLDEVVATLVITEDASTTAGFGADPKTGGVLFVFEVLDGSLETRTDLAQRSPHALQRVFGPCGPWVDR